MPDGSKAEMEAELEDLWDVLVMARAEAEHIQRARGRPRKEATLPEPGPDRWLSVDQARAYFGGCSLSTLYRRFAERHRDGSPRIRVVKDGGRTLVSESSLREYTESLPGFISRTTS